ncbi:MAG: hypothetical protein ACTJGX_05875 [Corynebacterium casei]|uniref:hypothetical protein n=1 Tax=Corynebacterium casei TaxID=160386 RepID=UPI0026473F7E|nr:hypothetical protein [Corynebacterium casei]MDN5783220.1 hypothetical protein [Corynebacterium casei]MDN5827129.1 hypothetical protein [Corynebacterium casei]MDN6392285.1 hypothetical protein [Corynebacterium casei]MDN6415055.1 hypothetical protein [Corynebacterium casei]MDN6709569.1 hypothetical protein [Corynebacterium casei]
MNKSVAITALAVSALALASCSTEASNDDSADNGAMTQTATQESPETTEETSAETSETSSETTTTTALSSGRFDEAALKSELEGMGYQCDDDDDCTKTEGAIIYDVDIDDDSVDVEVQGNDDLDQHFETILTDVGTAFGEYDFGGASWDEIQTWGIEAGEDEENVLGNVELEHDRGEDDGIPSRDLSVELIES